jgi:cytochrome c-type biogenesis protein CcmE
MLSTVGYLISASFVDNKISYLSINDLKATQKSFVGKEIKITGKVIGDKLEEKLTSEGKVYRFRIKDKMTKNNPAEITVLYTGVLPDSFQENADVVCTGELNKNGDFVAHSIIAKCPSKYESEGDKHPDEIKMEKK